MGKKRDPGGRGNLRYTKAKSQVVLHLEEEMGNRMQVSNSSKKTLILYLL